MTRLTTIQVNVIEDMIEDGGYTLKQMSLNAGCSINAVVRIRSNITAFGMSRSPIQRTGPHSMITPDMRASLRMYLSKRSDRYLEEMRSHLYAEFGTLPSITTISKTLKSMRWSKKINRRRAKERNDELRDFYMYKISHFHSRQLVFVDESGCDNREGNRKMGWAPIGVAPIQVAQFRRGKRYQILPAYTQDGLILAYVYEGSTDSSIFEAFVERLLPLCGRWPEPRSVLVMDNASIHHSERVKQMCSDAGVIVIYLPPYSPDFNPIEEFFAELKGFMKRNWDSPPFFKAVPMSWVPGSVARRVILGVQDSLLSSQPSEVK